MPSQDASSAESAPTEMPSPDAPVDPSLMAQPEAGMPSDPMTAAPMDPNAGTQPMGGEMNDDSAEQPDMSSNGEEAPVEGMEDANGGNDIQGMIAQLSDKQQETAAKYIQSMIDDNNKAAPAPGPQDAPMMESIIITKKQMQTLSEAIGCNNEELSSQNVEDKTEKPLKNQKGITSRNPFNGKRN